MGSRMKVRNESANRCCKCTRIEVGGRRIAEVDWDEDISDASLHIWCSQGQLACLKKDLTLAPKPFDRPETAFVLEVAEQEIVTKALSS